MENPPSFVVTPIAAPVPAEFTKLTFRSLYIRRAGQGSRQVTMEGESGLGTRYFSDFPVYDGTGSDAKLVARVQGVSIDVVNTHQIFTIVFENERLKGSTLLTNGVITGGSDDWAIYGGTGVFAMATGVIKRKYLAVKSVGNSDELTIEVFCPVFGNKGSVMKIGLWGGPGGSVKDITEPPKRLQSITIGSGDGIDSIQFTYTDKAGQKHTVGPWGQGGKPQTINLDDAEYVKEVSGTHGMYGNTPYLSSLTLVTSTRTFGPWGKKNGTAFTITAPTSSNIVGFYGSFENHVYSIGVYVREL